MSVWFLSRTEYSLSLTTIKLSSIKGRKKLGLLFKTLTKFFLLRSKDLEFSDLFVIEVLESLNSKTFS